jgi:exosome complex protein LRP1
MDEASLRLNEVDARKHPIFTELTRVKQYFEKIQKLEAPVEERTATVDTQAAIRFIRSDLVSVDYDGFKMT